MDAARFASNWHEAFDRAGFDIYEPDTDQYRWAGGYSGASHHVAVRGLVGNHTVTVDTWHDPALVDTILREVSAIQLEGRHRVENGGEPPLDEPRIERDDRVVRVGDTSHRCPGRRLVGVTNLWAGQLAIEDVGIQIATTSPSHEIAVRICTDPHALTRTPPPRR